MPLITQAARVFELVALSGSIRKAAERANSAPSAINRQILNLEAEMGTPLFERHPRGMRLTEAGAILVEQIRKWQASERDTRSAVEAVKGRSGHIRIGVMECFANEFMPRIYSRLRGLIPNVAFDVTVGGTDHLAKLMLADDIDLALAFNMPSEFGFRTLHEVSMRLGVVMPPDHELAKLKEIPLEKLVNSPFVLADNTLTVGPLIKTILERPKMSPEGVATSNSVEFIKALVKQGVGLSFLTWSDVYTDVQRSELRIAPIIGTRMSEHLSLTTRHTDQGSEASKKLIEIINSAIDEHSKEAWD